MTNDESLIEAIKTSINVSDTCRKLGIVPAGGNYKTIRNKIKKLGIDISHFNSRRCGQSTLHNIPKEKLEDVVKESTSYRQVCQKVGLRLDGQVITNAAATIKAYGFNTSHFSGQGWLKGKTHNNFPEHLKTKDEDLFVEEYIGGITTGGLKKRLFKAGREEKCEKCNNTTWNGLPIPLELDHINGNTQDNRRENLAILCPNCHAQTPTYRGKNLTQYKD